jgi:hypothetical protein
MVLTFALMVASILLGLLWPRSFFRLWRPLNSVLKNEVTSETIWNVLPAGA